MFYSIKLSNVLCINSNQSVKLNIYRNSFFQFYNRRMAFSMKSLKRTFSQNRTTHDANDVLDKITVHIYIDVLEPKENGYVM